MVAGIFDCMNVLFELLDNHIMQYTAYMTDVIIDNVPTQAIIFENEKKHTKGEYDSMIAAKAKVIQADRFDRCAFVCQKLSGIVPKDYWCQEYSEVFYDFNDLSGARGKVTIRSNYEEKYVRVGDDAYVNLLSHRMKEYVSNFIEHLIESYYDVFCEHFDREILKQKCMDAYNYFEEFQRHGYIEIHSGLDDFEYYVITRRTEFSKEKISKLVLSYTDGTIINEEAPDTQIEEVKSGKVLSLELLHDKIIDFSLTLDSFDDLDFWLSNYKVFLG